MKYYCLLFVATCFSLNLRTQEISDSIYNNFTVCIKKFLAEIRLDAKDSAVIFFHSKNFIFEKSYHSGGINYSISKRPNSQNELTKDTGLIDKKILILEGVSFAGFLNYIISSDSLSRSKISKLYGTWGYVYVPIEGWEQFYLDYLIHYDSLFIFPSIDLFEFKNNFTEHIRYELKCTYLPKSGFFVERVTVLRRDRIINK